MEKKIKKAFTCAKVGHFTLNANILPYYIPQMGDVGIFEVTDAGLGQIVDLHGNTRNMFEGDIIMAAFGSRYATSQLEGYVPETPTTNCHLLGRGGVAGVLVSVNKTMRKSPTAIKLLGYATDEQGKVINTIASTEMDIFSPLTINSKVILSIGTSMDSGKTTTAAYLCGGFQKAGISNAYLKLTGTAYPKDAAYVLDRGADFVADFTAFGYPSTFLCEHNEILDLYQSLVNLAQAEVQPEYIVVEIADGILQRETLALLKDSRFMNTVHQVIFSCGDSMGVFSGLDFLEKLNIRPFAVSGLFTASDLLINEVQNRLHTPILTLSDLLTGKALECLTSEKTKQLQFTA